MHADIMFTLLHILGSKELVRDKQGLDSHLSESDFHAFRAIGDLILTDGQCLEERV